MFDRAVGEDRQVGGAAANVDQAYPQVPLVTGQDRLGRGEGLEHDVHDVEPGLVRALHDVLGAGDGRGHDVDLRLEADAAHSQGFPDPVLVIDDELLGNHVDDLPVHRDRHRLGGVDDAAHVVAAHLSVLHGDDAVGVEALDVSSRNPRVYRRDLAVRHQLRFFHGVLDGIDGGVDVDDDALAQSLRRVRTDSDDIGAVLCALRNDRADLGGADVEAHDQIVFACHSIHPPYWGRRIIQRVLPWTDPRLRVDP